MVPNKRVRFPAGALAPESEELYSSRLSYDDVCDFKRLSGFCLVPQGGRAACLNDSPAMLDLFRTLKPSYEWTGDATAGGLDLLVGDGILQDVYTQARGNTRRVQDFLVDLASRLNDKGLIVLRENALLVPEQEVLLELPDHRRKIGKIDPAQAITKRLLEYAAMARPWLKPNLRGFFVEELPNMRPDSRLFRLPLKWAAEFLLRKDLNDTAWAGSMDQEFIIGNERALRRQVFAPLGLRVLVQAPHWDSRKTDFGITGSFQLYDEDRRPMSPPPTEMVIVLQKAVEHDGLWLAEQRTHGKDPEQLGLCAVRHEEEGDTLTLVTGLSSMVQVFPWRRLKHGGIGVYLRPETPQPLSNMLARSVNSIDGRRFAAFMPKPLETSMENWEEIAQSGMKGIADWLREHAGLKPATRAELVEGKVIYPAPDFIDQAMTSVFIEVKEENEDLQDLVCFEASDLLQAVHAGLVPIATLEAQLWQLAEQAGGTLTPMTDREVDVQYDPHGGEKLKVTPWEALCRKLAPDGKGRERGYQDIRGHSGTWRVGRSTFVEESKEGPKTSYEQEFVLNEEEPLHRAVLVCMSRNIDGEALVGFDLVDCPVPSRYGKPGKMVRLPSIPLPTNLRSVPEAREYVAKQLEVRPNNVVPCGEAVYTHIGVTPQKIFPFMITRVPKRPKKAELLYAPIDCIYPLTHLDNSDSFLWKWGLALKMMGEDTEATLNVDWQNRAKEREAHTRVQESLRVIAKNYG